MCSINLTFSENSIYKLWHELHHRWKGEKKYPNIRHIPKLQYFDFVYPRKVVTFALMAKLLFFFFFSLKLNVTQFLTELWISLSSITSFHLLYTFFDLLVCPNLGIGFRSNFIDVSCFLFDVSKKRKRETFLFVRKFCDRIV